MGRFMSRDYRPEQHMTRASVGGIEFEDTTGVALRADGTGPASQHCGKAVAEVTYKDETGCPS